MQVVYQGTDGADHTATVTPELVVYAEGKSGTFPSKLAGDALVITSVSGAPPATGDPAAVLGGGGPVTVSGFVEGASTDHFSNDQISDVRDGNGTATGHVEAAWRIGYGAQVPGEALLPALRDGFRRSPPTPCPWSRSSASSSSIPPRPASSSPGRWASRPPRGPPSSRAGCSTSA